jgi:predicted amidophosphoribosyltransferase
VHLWATLVDLTIGRRCLDCGLVGAPWCDRCLHAVLDVHGCVTPGERAVVAASRYGGSVRTAVLDHKEQGHLALSIPLGRLLAAATTVGRGGVGQLTPVLVPVPSTRAASRSRGQDHARRLARAAGAVIGLPVESSLQWSRHVQDQAGLSAPRRRENVQGAMCAERPAIAGAPAWLIDDVMTTGATLDEGARSLEAAGWQVVGVSVVAAVDARRALARRDLLR